MARLLIRQQGLVVFVRGEPDGHLGDDTSQHGTQTLVQTQSSLLLHNFHTGGYEATRLSLLYRNMISNGIGVLQRVDSRQEVWLSAKAASGP